MRALCTVVVLVLALTLPAAVLAEEGRWQALENNPACVVWNSYPIYPDTVTWSGVCTDGKAHGRGTEVWQYVEDGEWKESRYEGWMRDGKRHGHGVIVWASGARYEGDWKDDKSHGHGVYESKDGARYEGDHKDGKFHGHGVLVLPDGKRYEGDWKDGNLTIN